MLRALLDLLVPPQCVLCRAPGTTLCGACRASVRFLPRRRCPRCALPAPCGRRCPAASAAFDAAWAPVAYEGGGGALVAALKFRGALGVADLMAAQIAAGAPPGALAPGAVLIPAPTHPARRRARGFDQAECLARALARRTGLEMRTALRRSGAQDRQLGATKATRTQTGRIVVRCAGPAPPHCVLVDDVHTTGATLDACARALRAAGARRVVAISYARVS